MELNYLFSLLFLKEKKQKNFRTWDKSITYDKPSTYCYPHFHFFPERKEAKEL